MHDLSKEALARLEELRQGDRGVQPLPIPRQTIMSLPVGSSYRQRTIEGDGTGTQILIGPDPKRTAFIVCRNNFALTISLDSPVVTQRGVSLDSANAITVFKREEWGRLVEYQWFVFLNLFDWVTVFEILQS